MWDLTVTSDHDFYVAAADTAILVHNCPPVGGSLPKLTGSYADSFEGGVYSERTFNAGTVFYRAEAWAAKAPGRFLGTEPVLGRAVRSASWMGSGVGPARHRGAPLPEPLPPVVPGPEPDSVSAADSLPSEPEQGDEVPHRSRISIH